LTVLDVVREIGERMGRAIAIYLLGSGPECRDAPWSGIYSLDPDLDDELERVGILPGTPEFEEAERAAKQAYERTMATAFADD
jgi:hypothetical protein